MENVVYYSKTNSLLEAVNMALTIGFHLLVIGLTILGIMAPVAVAPAEAGFVANLTSPSTYQINQGYLYAEYNATLGSVHHGVDFSCPSGSNVTAAASGTVIVSADLGGSSNPTVCSYSNPVRSRFFLPSPTPR